MDGELGMETEFSRDGWGWIPKCEETDGD